MDFAVLDEFLYVEIPNFSAFIIRKMCSTQMILKLGEEMIVTGCKIRALWKVKQNFPIKRIH